MAWKTNIYGGFNITDSLSLMSYWSGKQDALIAGTNIQISPENVISATDTTYSSSDFDIKDLTDSLSLKTTWSAKQDALVSTTNIKSINGTTLLGAGDLSTPNTTYTDSDFDIKDLTDITSLRSEWSGKQDALGFTPEDSSNKGQNSGYCGLDAGGKVAIANLPATLLLYKGVWNAETNTPALTATDTDKKGWVYNVGTAGTQFTIDFELGDWAIYNDEGNIEKSDNSDDVVSVNSQQGVVVLDADDIDDTSTTNKWTDSTEKSTWNGKQDLLVSATNIKTINSVTLLGAGNIDTTYTSSDFDLKDLTDSTNLKTTWNGKQDALVSTTNIKSINGTTLLGAGDLSTPNTTYTASDFDIKDLTDSTTLRTTWSAKQDALGFTPQDASKLVTAWSTPTTDTNYASEKLAKDTMDAHRNILTTEQLNNYTLALIDNYTMVDMNKISAVTLTVPKNSVVSFPLGSIITISQTGVGQVTIAPVDGDVTLQCPVGLKITLQYGMATLLKVAENIWRVTGMLEA